MGLVNAAYTHPDPADADDPPTPVSHVAAFDATSVPLVVYSAIVVGRTVIVATEYHHIPVICELEPVTANCTASV
jgi:hypothetical protein